jgi:hypothetical protein
VQHEIGAEIEGPLENRRREGVVDQTESAVAMGDFRRRSDVGDAEQRVGRRLDPDKPGARVTARSISLTLEVSTKENVSPKFSSTALKSR